MNRKLISNLATLHFAPTEKAKKALLKEGIEESRIFLCGNTSIDALILTLTRNQVIKKHWGTFIGSGVRHVLGKLLLQKCLQKPMVYSCIKPIKTERLRCHLDNTHCHYIITDV